MFRGIVDKLLRVGSDPFGFDISQLIDGEEIPSWVDPLALFDIWDLSVKIGILSYDAFDRPIIAYPAVMQGIMCSIRDDTPIRMRIYSTSSPMVMLSESPGTLYKGSTRAVGTMPIIARQSIFSLMNGVVCELDLNCSSEETQRSIAAMDQWAAMNGFAVDGERRVLPLDIRTTINPALN